MKLYILKFRNHDVIKIGITNNTTTRARALGLSHFDLENSYTIHGESSAIRRLEKQLHEDFRTNKITPGKQLSSGNTELFSSSIIEKVLAEIRHKIERFPHHNLQIMKGITIPKPPAFPSLEHPRTLKYKEYGVFGVREFIESLKENKHITIYTHKGLPIALQITHDASSPKENIKSITVTGKYYGYRITLSSLYFSSTIDKTVERIYDCFRCTGF